jgi:hypothetical protein
MLSFASLRGRLASALTLAVIAALALLALLAGRSWLAAHDAAIHLAATLKAQEQVLTEANQRQRERDASLAAALAQINAAKRRVNTPAQAAAAIPDALPPLPQPLELQLPPPTPGLPDPPAVATVPQADLKPIYDYLQDCRACQISLAATRENLTDERAKLSAVTTERDAAIQAARGGTTWQRLKRNAKWFALGAAASAAAAAATR